VTNTDRRDPFLNTRFRVEIEGLSHTGVVEVVFPEARILGRRGKTAILQYGSLTLKRGMTGSADWFRWWDAARGAAAARRTINVVLMDRLGADVQRWTFPGAVPVAYVVSPLNAIQSETLMETLELSVGGLSLTFGADAHTDDHAATKSRTRKRARRS
jgi:phage tail-like protein